MADTSTLKSPREQRGYASGCKCHGATFCPDLICVDMVDDVPVFARRDSPEGKAQAERLALAEIDRDRREFERLKPKYGWQS